MSTIHWNKLFNSLEPGSLEALGFTIIISVTTFQNGCGSLADDVTVNERENKTSADVITRLNSPQSALRANDQSKDLNYVSKPIPSYALGLSGGPFYSPNLGFWDTVIKPGCPSCDFTWITGYSFYNHPVLVLKSPPTPADPADYTVTAVFAIGDTYQECGLVVRGDFIGAGYGAGYLLSMAWGGTPQPTIGLIRSDASWNPSYIASGAPYVAYTHTQYAVKMHINGSLLQGKVWNIFREGEPLDWQVQANVPDGPNGTNFGFYSYGAPSPELVNLGMY